MRTEIKKFREESVSLSAVIKDMRKRAMNKKKALTTMAACGLVAALGVGGTMAYLTDSEQTTNTFTIGKVKIDVQEPGWDTTDKNNNNIPDKAEDVVPNQELAKNPLIENTGSNSAVVFLKVTVPTKYVTQVADDGTVSKDGRKSQEIFYFKDVADAQNQERNNFDANWQELVDEEVQDTGATASKDGVRTYVFGYKTKLLKGQKTSSLFDKIQMKNVIEDEILPDSANDIKVEGFAIQSEEILDKTGKDLTDELTTANLKTIYDIFIKQGTSYDAAHGTTTGHDYSGNEKDANTNNSKDVHGNNR